MHFLKFFASIVILSTYDFLSFEFIYYIVV